MTTTETTSTSWFSRIGSSLRNILLGFVLLIVAVGLLYWNEGRAVKTEQSLTEGKSVVVSVVPDTISPTNDRKLVHFSGMAQTSGVLSDDEFGIRDNALKMKRIVEMYQWKEKSSSKTVNKLGGGTETTTTYTYSKEWNNSPIDSSNFRESNTHLNPTTKPFADQEWISPDTKVGMYMISPDMLASLSGYQQFLLTQGMLDVQSSSLPAQLKLVDNTLYYQTLDVTKPEVGNTRIRYEVIAPQVISVIYKQTGDTLVPYSTKNGETIHMIELGSKTAGEMFQNAQDSNKTMTWILRAVGALLMFVGFQLILGVLPVVGSVIPFVGSIVGVGVGLVSFLLTIAISCIVIAIAWLAYRPILAVALIAVAVASYVILIQKSKKI